MHFAAVSSHSAKIYISIGLFESQVKKSLLSAINEELFLWSVLQEVSVLCEERQRGEQYLPAEKPMKTMKSFEQIFLCAERKNIL